MAPVAPPVNENQRKCTIIGMKEYFPAPVGAGCSQPMRLYFDDSIPDRMKGLQISEKEWKEAIAEINGIIKSNMSSMKWSLLLVFIPCCYLALLHAVQGKNMLNRNRTRQKIEKVSLPNDKRIKFSFNVTSNGNKNANHWMWLEVYHPELMNY